MTKPYYKSHVRVNYVLITRREKIINHVNHVIDIIALSYRINTSQIYKEPSCV